MHAYIPHFVSPFIIHGHLGCFHLLVTVKNAAVNIGIKYLFGPLLSKYFWTEEVKVELLDYVVILCLIFLFGNGCCSALYSYQ